jgi:hypothetical protein
MLIDVAIPGARSVIKKEVEKILKYNDLIIEIQRMWKVKAKVIPVEIGASGTISESLRQYLATQQESTKLRTCIQQPYWALQTLRKVLCKSTKHISWTT